MSDTVMTPASVISERDAAILDFERGWWQLPIAKDQAIRERFSLSGAQYYQILNSLIDTREALAFDPLLVKRLRRLRAQRRAERVAGRVAYDQQAG